MRWRLITPARLELPRQARRQRTVARCASPHRAIGRRVVSYVAAETGLGGGPPCRGCAGVGAQETAGALAAEHLGGLAVEEHRTAADEHGGDSVVVAVDHPRQPAVLIDRVQLPARPVQPGFRAFLRDLDAHRVAPAGSRRHPGRRTGRPRRSARLRSVGTVGRCSASHRCRHGSICVDDVDADLPSVHVARVTEVVKTVRGAGLMVFITLFDGALAQLLTAAGRREEARAQLDMALTLGRDIEMCFLRGRAAAPSRAHPHRPRCPSCGSGCRPWHCPPTGCRLVRTSRRAR